MELLTIRAPHIQVYKQLLSEGLLLLSPPHQCCFLIVIARWWFPIHAVTFEAFPPEWPTRVFFLLTFSGRGVCMLLRQLPVVSERLSLGWAVICTVLHIFPLYFWMNITVIDAALTVIGWRDAWKSVARTFFFFFLSQNLLHFCYCHYKIEGTHFFFRQSFSHCNILKCTGLLYRSRWIVKDLEYME